MSFVIYHRDSNTPVRFPTSEAAADRLVSKLNSGLGYEAYGVTTESLFNVTFLTVGVVGTTRRVWNMEDSPILEEFA